MNILIETLLVITLLLTISLILTLKGKGEDVPAEGTDTNLYLDSEGNHAHYDKTSIRIKTMG